MRAPGVVISGKGIGFHQITTGAIMLGVSVPEQAARRFGAP
jgi:hypothetical protein